MSVISIAVPTPPTSPARDAILVPPAAEEDALERAVWQLELINNMNRQCGHGPSKSLFLPEVSFHYDLSSFKRYSHSEDLLRQARASKKKSSDSDKLKVSLQRPTSGVVRQGKETLDLPLAAVIFDVTDDLPEAFPQRTGDEKSKGRAQLQDSDVFSPAIPNPLTDVFCRTPAPPTPAPHRGHMNTFRGKLLTSPRLRARNLNLQSSTLSIVPKLWKRTSKHLIPRISITNGKENAPPVLHRPQRDRLPFPKMPSHETSSKTKVNTPRTPILRIRRKPVPATPLSPLKISAPLLKPPPGEVSRDPRLGISINHFALKYKLGAGAQGCVYLATVREGMGVGTHRKLALKVINKKAGVTHPGFMLREQRALQRLTMGHDREERRGNPFVLELIASFHDSENFYVVTPFHTGGDLQEVLNITGRFSTRLTTFYSAEMISAITYLHDNAIIHRDIKLANVLLKSDGHIALGDFGLVKDFLPVHAPNTLGGMSSVPPPHEQTTASFAGTSSYMAPEALWGGRYGKSVDWWAFAVCMYVMLQGQVPWPHKDFSHQRDAITRTPLMWRSFVYVDPMAKDLVDQMLVKDVLSRPSVEGVKNHDFFSHIKWKEVAALKMTPPYRPTDISDQLIAASEGFDCDDFPIGYRLIPDPFPEYTFVQEDLRPLETTPALPRRQRSLLSPASSMTRHSSGSHTQPEGKGRGQRERLGSSTSTFRSPIVTEDTEHERGLKPMVGKHDLTCTPSGPRHQFVLDTPRISPLRIVNTELNTWGSPGRSSPERPMQTPNIPGTIEPMRRTRSMMDDPSVDDLWESGMRDVSSHADGGFVVVSDCATDHHYATPDASSLSAYSCDARISDMLRLEVVDLGDTYPRSRSPLCFDFEEPPVTASDTNRFENLVRLGRKLASRISARLWNWLAGLGCSLVKLFS